MKIKITISGDDLENPAEIILKEKAFEVLGKMKLEKLKYLENWVDKEEYKCLSYILHQAHIVGMTLNQIKNMEINNKKELKKYIKKHPKKAKRLISKKVIDKFFDMN